MLTRVKQGNIIEVDENHLHIGYTFPQYINVL